MTCVKLRYALVVANHLLQLPTVSTASCPRTVLACMNSCSLPRLCLEGFLLSGLKGPGNGKRPGRFPRHPPRGSPSYVSLA
eukprot:9476419-Pyramimonas_sp.AAC.1